jgi:hypothetical protein
MGGWGAEKWKVEVEVEVEAESGKWKVEAESRKWKVEGRKVKMGRLGKNGRVNSVERTDTWMVIVPASPIYNEWPT